MFRKKLKTGFSKKLIPIALLGETKNKKSNLEREFTWASTHLASFGAKVFMCGIKTEPGLKYCTGALFAHLLIN